MLSNNFQRKKTKKLSDLKVTEYDAGQMVYSCGWIIPETCDAPHHHYYIRFRGLETGWAITESRSDRLVMSKSQDNFIWEKSPSERTDEDYADTRFSTPRKALAFLEKWKRKELKRIKQENMQVWPHPRML